MRFTFKSAIFVALVASAGANAAYTETEAIDAVKGLFVRQSPGAGAPGQQTPSSPFDPKSPNSPPQCRNDCNTAFNAGDVCKDAKCLCTAEHTEALGKCVNCVIAANVGSPIEAAFAISIFEEVCKGNGISNLPTPTVSLPPHFSLPPGMSTGAHGEFTIGTTVTAAITDSFETTTVTIPPPSATSTSPHSSSSSHQTSGSPTSTASHSNAAAFAAPTGLAEFVPMAVMGAIMAMA
ncbi:hypothetical protein PLEOSDRAFT_1109998 [Pleurotus ostreatus PC15]|uniref:Extracellular membrane protein CFEM domain-containing protein n=2 Tax=Pleurotus TaxID=5320 RepID=A0A067N4H4_PLEO1|nr:hypothetical protein CCMSSC00406_0006253 [Pleurotus cornucopiae]KDQ22908.1 hypothetical protein PLEOSDRAFT_1109998 [Pleurotus ostreatus PC15]